jgi:hypothetical protein
MEACGHAPVALPPPSPLPAGTHGTASWVRSQTNLLPLSEIEARPLRCPLVNTLPGSRTYSYDPRGTKCNETGQFWGKYVTFHTLTNFAQAQICALLG